MYKGLSGYAIKMLFDDDELFCFYNFIVYSNAIIIHAGIEACFV